MAPERILVIEPDAELVEVITYHLRREGYRVDTAARGRAGLQEVRRAPPALVLLDVALPDGDGHDVCRLLRQDADTAQTAVILLSEAADETGVAEGLDAGADDCLRRPFSNRELVARVRAVLRRRREGPPDEVRDRLVRGDLVVDRAGHQARIGGAAIPLTATEFRLLYALAAQPGRAFTREELRNRAIGENSPVDARNVDVHVRAVRRKLGGLGASIESVRGVGYRFRPVSDEPR